jgi:phosphoglycolate phosphatase-like HAD superfamily hydrolase
MIVVLFDIDGTLLNCHDSARRSYNATFAKLFSITNAMEDVSVHGQTDPSIIHAVATKHLNRDFTDTEISIVENLYLHFLSLELADSSRFDVLPGAHNLCRRLLDSEKFIIGIQTGNFERAAWCKLKRASMNMYFKFGGFGSDSSIRAELVRIAIDRGVKLYNMDRDDIEGIYLIGDSPQDITSGKTAGIKTIAVASGSYSHPELEKGAPDFLLNELNEAINIFF